jgi:hypothetical protein
VTMFFITLGHGFGNRIVQKRFQHLAETISGHFTRVLMAVSRKAIEIINPIDREFITLSHGFGNRIVEERFQHLRKTIGRHFTRVLMAIPRMAIEIINPIDREFMDVPSKIRDDKRCWLYFKDCIGAIDGIHVSVKISPSKQIPYIGQKGTLYSEFYSYL